jgi:hypothetical protein
MAVVNDYVNTAVAAGNVAEGYRTGGKQVKRLIETFNPAAADDDGSIYRIANLPLHAVIVDAKICNAAVTGMTDADLGFYQTADLGGAVIDKDILLDGGDLSSAHASGSELSAISNVAAADRYKRIFELLGLSVGGLKGNVDIALTANTAGSGTGAITVIIDFIDGV